MISRIVLAATLALVLSDLASAGCRNRYCQTCYPPKTYASKSVGWREAAAIIEKQQIEVDAFLAYQQRHAGTYQQNNVQINGGSPAYSATVSGTVSQYPIPGSTFYGQYGTNPVVQDAANQQAYQRFMGMIIQGTHQGMMDQADLAKIEAEQNVEIAKAQAIGSAFERMAVATRNPGEFRKVEFTAQYDPVSQQVTVIQPGAAEQAPAQGLTFEGVLAAKCASCHSGAHAQGGVDLTGELSDELFGKVVNDVRTGKMPMMKDAQGNFVDGEDLSNEELAVICEAYLAR